MEDKLKRVIKNVEGIAGSKVKFIWVRGQELLYGLQGGKLRKLTYTAELKIDKGMYKVNEVVVGVGREKSIETAIKRLWLQSKKGEGTVRKNLQDKYKHVKDKDRKLKRVEMVVNKLIQEGKIRGRYKYDKSRGEVYVKVKEGEYYFGVNYAVRVREGVEEELFEIVPHKESLQTAVIKCRGMGAGSWVKEVIMAYDLRRKRD